MAKLILHFMFLIIVLVFSFSRFQTNSIKATLNFVSKKLQAYIVRYVYINLI